MPASQVREEAAAVAVHCGAELSVTALAGEGHAAARRAAVGSAGQVVIATPGRIAQVGARMRLLLEQMLHFRLLMQRNTTQ